MKNEKNIKMKKMRRKRRKHGRKKKRKKRKGTPHSYPQLRELRYFRAIQGHTGGNLMAPELMGHVAVPYKCSYFIEAVHLMPRQSSLQDSSLEVEKAKEEYRPFSSRVSTRSERIQTKKMTYQNRQRRISSHAE